MAAHVEDEMSELRRTIAGLEQKLRASLSERDEALAQQAATADILKAISSAFDLQSILTSLTDSAKSLCGAVSGVIFRREGDVYRYAASTMLVHPAYLEHEQKAAIRADRGTLIGRVALEKGAVQIPDAWTDPEYKEKDEARLGKVRAMLGVPLMLRGELIGAFGLARAEPLPFTQRQVELVTSFADQAVIAIENTRLLNETKEALERQTATSEILASISGSITDPRPVFEAVLDNLLRLFGTRFAVVFLVRDGLLDAAGLKGDADFEKLAAYYPVPVNDQLLPGKAIMTGRALQIAPIVGNPDAPSGTRDLAQKFGYNSLMAVPMIRQGKVIGALCTAHRDPVAFTDKQVELASSFADQAVIAIENARLFSEVQAKTRDLEESLQQQTATADVLKVIGRSAFDLNRVFETVVESSVRLCAADRAIIFRFDGKVLRVANVFNAPEELRSWLEQNPIRPGRYSVAARAALERRTVQVEDVRGDPEHTYGAKEIEPFRTVLGVPMLKGNDLLGVILVYHNEVKPFTDKQILLVSTFAEQAAIAIENARLFDEVQARTLELSRSLHDLRTAQDRLIQTEKLASLGQLTAGIAHEIKNPLNFVNNFSALSVELTDELNGVLKQATLADKIRDEVGELTTLLKDNLGKVVQHGKRADSIVKNMLLHSREGSGERRAADINALVGESLNLAYHGARAEKAGFSIALKQDFDPNAGSIELYPQEITRALLNLISNGFYAATWRKVEADDESFEPVLSAATRNLGETVEIRIRDNGTGIPPAIMEKIFNPFFTTKPTGEGTGLGLSMTHDIIVKQHGGRIDVETEPGVFTEFIISLPRNNGSVAGQKPE